MSSNGKFAAAGDERRMSILRQGARAVRYRLAAIVRYHLARHGLLLLNTRSRLGLDYIRDIEWLAQSRGYAVETFFDVGANVGETALAAFQIFPDVHVYSFEPHPSTFSNLRQRIGTGRKFSGENVILGLAVGNVDMFEYDISVPNKQSCPGRAICGEIWARRSAHIGVLHHFERLLSGKGIDRIDVLKIDTKNMILRSCKVLGKCWRRAQSGSSTSSSTTFSRKRARPGCIVPHGRVPATVWLPVHCKLQGSHRCRRRVCSRCRMRCLRRPHVPSTGQQALSDCAEIFPTPASRKRGPQVAIQDRRG